MSNKKEIAKKVAEAYINSEPMFEGTEVVVMPNNRLCIVPDYIQYIHGLVEDYRSLARELDTCLDCTVDLVHMEIYDEDNEDEDQPNVAELTLN